MKGKYALIFFQLVMPIWWFLSYLIPKDNNLFIFGATKQNKYHGNPKYLFEYLSKNKYKNSKSVFLTSNEEIFKALVKKGLEVEMRPLKKFILLLRAKYIFIEATPHDVAPFYILFGNFNIINLWHGTPLKKIESDSKHLNKFYLFATKCNNKKYSFIIAADFKTAEYISSAFENRSVIVSGYPRNDTFFDKTISEVLPEKMRKFENYSRVISYIPTFRDNTQFQPFSEECLHKIDNICKLKNYAFLIKEHPNVQCVKIHNKTNIFQVSSDIDDVQMLLNISDIIITDYSSVMFDFALTNRPIIFYNFDLDSYLISDRELYFDYKQNLPGPFAEDEGTLTQLISNIDDWANDKVYKNKYAQFKNRFNFYQDGDSSKRIIEFIDKGHV